jgi:hypothetical protein
MTLIYKSEKPPPIVEQVL